MKTELVATLRCEAIKISADVNDDELMVDRTKILEGIAKGEKAIVDGRVLTHDEARKKLSVNYP